MKLIQQLDKKEKKKKLKNAITIQSICVVGRVNFAKFRIATQSKNPYLRQQIPNAPARPGQ